MRGQGENFRVLRELIDAAAVAGVNDGLLRRSARALVDLADRPEADRRRQQTLERGHHIERLLAQGMARQPICERLGISADAYYRALRLLRESRNCFGVDLIAVNQEHPRMARKSAPLKNADLTPRPLYASGKPPVPAELQTAPRDNEGGMSSGKTGGNFDLSTMTSRPVNVGQNSTQDIADATSAEFAS